MTWPPLPLRLADGDLGDRWPCSGRKSARLAGHDRDRLDGHRLGHLEAIYVDTSSDEPTFLGAKMSGLRTGYRLTFVPTADLNDALAIPVAEQLSGTAEHACHLGVDRLSRVRKPSGAGVFGQRCSRLQTSTPLMNAR